MLWLALWITVLAFGMFGLVGWTNSLRFGHRVAREVREITAEALEPGRIDRRLLERLPPPARRYLAKAVGRRELAVRTVRFRHGGTFRTDLDGDWLPIRGEEYVAVDPPGFVWWGRLRIAPGLWIDARDRSVSGIGNLRVSAVSTFTLADSTGPEIDQGELLRLLSEMPLCPTALLDERYVSWTAVDDRRARATLRVNGREASGVFEFREDDGLPVAFVADRYRDLGGGRSVLTRWSGEFSHYHEVAGLLVPRHLVANWHIDGQRFPYAGFMVERLEYDSREPL